MTNHKRCQRCGRDGVRMMPILNRFFVGKIDGWRCMNPRACIRRMEQLGQWTGVRVLRRVDPDGTRWTIRGGRAGYMLLCEYRDHRASSWHPSIEAAKAHREDITTSWMSHSMREYAARSAK